MWFPVLCFMCFTVCWPVKNDVLAPYSDADWCHLNAASCISTSVRALVASSHLPLSFSQYTDNPVINTLQIWAQFRLTFGFKNLHHLSPIQSNHLFPPARLDPVFIHWQRQSVHNFNYMYINSTLASFGDFSNKFGLWLFHFITWLTPCSALDDLLRTFNLKGRITRINDYISSLSNTPLAKIKAEWVVVLAEDLEEDTWESVLLQVNNRTSMLN